LATAITTGFPPSRRLGSSSLRRSCDIGRSPAIAPLSFLVRDGAEAADSVAMVLPAFMPRRRCLAIVGPAAVVAVAAAFALTTAVAGAAGATSTCPVGGKGPATLAIYPVKLCVGNGPSPISGFQAAADIQNTGQYCSQEPPAGDATLGQGLISQAAGYQQPVAGWEQAGTAYFDAEKAWYTKHEKSESKKVKKTSEQIVKAINGVIPTIASMAASDTTFDADVTAAGTALTSQNCAQVQASLTQAETDQQTAEAAQTSFNNAFEQIIDIVSKKGYHPASQLERARIQS
jgi:hypothetical protein